MAKIGKSYHNAITNAKDAHHEALKFRRLIEKPLLTYIKVSFSGLQKVELEPTSVTDLLSSRPIVISGRVERLSISGILKN
ncbi:MAG: hypothetical protein ACK4GL_08245 [Flavobacteriales bacterium]